MILRGQGCGQTPDRRLALPIRGRLARSPAISQTCPAGPQGQHHRQPIGYHHKLAGHELPTNQEGVKVVLRGIRRTIGTARAGEGPQRNMIGRRDRALLALGCPRRAVMPSFNLHAGPARGTQDAHSLSPLLCRRRADR